MRLTPIASATCSTARRAVQRRHPHRGDDLTLPHQGHVAGLALVRRDQRGADGVEDGSHGSDERVAVHVIASTRATCKLTWLAPLANAARVMAATRSGISASSARHVDPNGPNSTSAPAAVA